MWEIILSNEIQNWLDQVDDSSYEAILLKVALLRELGPALGRPHADTIKESKH